MSTALSFRHHRVQRLRRLLRRAAVRASEGVFVVEGPTLLSTALDAGADIEAVYVDGAQRSRASLAPVVERALSRGLRVYDLEPGVIERVADTVTPQPSLAVVRMPAADFDSLRAATFVVVCVDVRDPGNTGAIIRGADAAGADAVVCCEGTADPFNPKTVRASAGSVLHLPVVTGVDPARALDALAAMGLRRLAAAAHGGAAHTSSDLTVPLALVVGNEASGLPEHLSSCVEGSLTIDLGGRAESLNVSLAAAVLCFEVRRQRSNLHAVEATR